MASVIQDSVLGQLIRLATGRKTFAYPEEQPGFEIPWQRSKVLEKEKELEGNASDSNSNRRISPAPGHVDNPIDASDQVLSQIETAQSGHLALNRVVSRNRSREETLPYSAERFEVEAGEELERAQSSVIAPQKTADGITLVDWYTTDDPANPQNWSSLKKAWVSFIIFMYTFAVYAGSSIYTSSEPQIMERFHVGQSKASLGLSMYVLGYGFGPMLFSPLSEIPIVGRNIPYVASLGLFVILSVPTALVDNYAGLLVLRFLTGFMGSPCLATGGASMGDMYSLLKLPYALTAWTAAGFSAPALGPLLSGFAVMSKNWRWSLWEILWMAGPVFLLMFATMPETSAANILLRRAKRLRKFTGDQSLKSQSEIDQGHLGLSQVAYSQLLKPLEITVKDPSVFFVNLYTSFIYGVYYSFFEAFPLVFINMYGFNIGELGIVFTCIIVGCVFGIIIYCSYVYWYLEPDIKKNGLRAQEHRLVPALFAVLFLPASLFWFGWTSEKSIHWIVPIIAITFYAIGAFVL
ncbi:hypothetical protein DV736_g5006, partial [Chaetothyriales sp. CBS 134916]